MVIVVAIALLTNLSTVTNIAFLVIGLILQSHSTSTDTPSNQLRHVQGELMSQTLFKHMADLRNDYTEYFSQVRRANEEIVGVTEYFAFERNIFKRWESPQRLASATVQDAIQEL